MSEEVAEQTNSLDLVELNSYSQSIETTFEIIRGELVRLFGIGFRPVPPVLRDVCIHAYLERRRFDPLHSYTPNEIKHACFLAYWIKKLRPFVPSVDDRETVKGISKEKLEWIISHINEIVGVLAILGVLAELGRNLSETKFGKGSYFHSLLENIHYKYISVDALILIFESES